MVCNGYALFIQGGGQYGGILDYTFIITKYLGRVHDRDPEHVKFETQCGHVFYAGYSCYTLTIKGNCFHIILYLSVPNDGCPV